MKTLPTLPTLAPLFDVSRTREIEQRALGQTSEGALMKAAGTACARLALALCPHARQIWVLCGNGYNGVDGLLAATVLARASAHNGCCITVSWAERPPEGEASKAAWEQAVHAGVLFSAAPPTSIDLAIDAMVGIGGHGPLRAPLVERVRQLEHASVVLCLDTPSGLDPDTGTWLSDAPPPSPTQRRATLSLLTLKPGLFTHQGRDWAGQVWLDDLDTEQLDLEPPPASAYLLQSHSTDLQAAPLAHASHKGSFGQVTVIGGQPPGEDGKGMLGAAVLAARAALHGGAGRVYLAALGNDQSPTIHAQPDLMQRALDDCWLGQDGAHHVWVAGCGGGNAIAAVLPQVLQHAGPLVLDADALNHIASNPSLANALIARAAQSLPTVMTPHPLEAARLLGTRVSEVQAQRLDCAQVLSERFGATVVLKGSGTVIAAPGQTPWINHSGNARLAIAGTGDVLAGLIGATLARHAGDVTTPSALRHWVAHAVRLHGQCALNWRGESALTASRLAESLQPL